MKLAALISGGKDSIYAAYKASKEHKIACLISFKSRRSDSYMFHTPNIELVKQQAKAMQLPLIFMESSGIKEKELNDIKKALKLAIKKYSIQGVVSGALASNYQKSRIDKLCNELKLKSIAPLWHIDPEQYLKDLISQKSKISGNLENSKNFQSKNNFKSIITAIAADGLTKEFLGAEINNEFIKKIKKLKIHFGGEGGEYESLVLDCPLFNKKLKVKKAKIEMENCCTGNFIVEDAELANK